MRKSVIVLMLLCCGYAVAQKKCSTDNRLGVGVEGTYFAIANPEVQVTGKLGWAAGVESRGPIHPDWDLAIGMQFFSHAFSVREALTMDEIEMRIIGAQVKLLFAYQPLRSDFLSLELGTAISFNGELKVRELDYESSIIDGDGAVVMQSFQQTSPMNIYTITGISLGSTKTRFVANYNYALLDGLNGKNASSEDLNGNMSHLSLGMRYYF